MVYKQHIQYKNDQKMCLSVCNNKINVNKLFLASAFPLLLIMFAYNVGLIPV